MSREYTIDFNNPEQAARTTLKMHIDTLDSFRHTTDHPAELEWEIRLYEFMLQDPVPRLKLYQEARWPELGKPPISKRAVVEKLGWVVP